ncbi:MAG: hypothetical protein ACYTGW_10805 [Planctomycetota bacterium]
MVGIGAGAVVVVLVAVWALNGPGSDKPARPATPSRNQSATDAVLDREPSFGVPAVKTRGRPGKPPDRPAPAIQEADVAQAEALYREAKRLDIEARKAQKAGDNTTFNRLINDAWDKLEEVGPILQAYNDWFELADLEDWAIPASYLRYQKRIEKIEKLRGRMHRIRPMRRK